MWAWIKNHWRLILVTIGGGLAFVLGGFATRRLRLPDAALRRELDAARAGTEAAAKAVEEGAERALADLVEQHQQLIDTFDDEQREKMKRLVDDPPAMARWLTRLSE